MRQFFTRSLIIKLAAWFLAVSIIPMVVIGYLAFDTARNSLQQSQFEKLTAERDLRCKELLAAFNQTLQNLVFLSETAAVRSAVETLTSYHEYNKTSPGVNFDVTSDFYNRIYSKINSFFVSFMKAHDAALSGYRDIILISNTDGDVMYTALKLTDLGTNLQRGPLKDSGLANVWNKVLKTGKPALIDFTIYEPSKSPSAFMGVPVLTEDGKPIGMLVLRFGPEQINSIFAAAAQVGKTAETYLVGEDLLKRSDSLSGEKSAVLSKKIDSEPVRKALSGGQGMETASYRTDTPVLSAYSSMGLRQHTVLGADFDWAVLSEINVDEAFQPIAVLRSRVIFLGLVMGLLVLVAAYFTARGMARPIVSMAQTVTRVSEGDLRVDVPYIKRSDELGTLVNAFRTMIGSLRDQTREVMTAVNTLAGSSAEIFATVNQLVSNTSRTSAAVNETVATVEELKQAAKLSSTQAKSVSTRAQETVEVSRSGQEATEDTIKGMNLIKHQMESIGETVVRLSDQSRTIEGIISMVQDLADQSNLLAVNASIEAARAGDQGKGFEVVAHEIKSLSDQSRQGTEQIRSALQETQGWVNAVVMATEQGTKVVDNGVRQSSAAGQSIEMLSKNLVESTQAASVIVASSDQQFVGIEQVAAAIQNIDAVMKQNLNGVMQIKDLATDLNVLGESLKTLVAKHRV